MALNTEQQQVVNELERNVLLIASAGTGKTNTLACRVAHILQEQGEVPMLCMTFTNKACKEMKERIASMAGPLVKAVEVRTFHSFCYFLLEEESKRKDSLYTASLIFDEQDSADLFSTIKPKGMRDIVFANLMSFLKEMRSLCGYYSDDEVADYEQTLAYIRQHKFKEVCQIVGNAISLSELWEQWVSWLLAYNDALRSASGVDFTDLITMTHRALQDPVVSGRWRKRYPYICVDEMQDTSRLEYEVMRILFQGNHILLCGDYFQTIYEWRGSDPFHILEDYNEEFQPRKIVFYDNYRSNGGLFDTAFVALQRMFPDLVQSIYDEMPRAVQGMDSTAVTVTSCYDEYEEAMYIYNQVQVHSGSQAVLVRDNRKAMRLSDILQRLSNANHGPQFMIIDEFKFFRRQEIKDVMAYFKLLLNRNDRVSAIRIIKRYVSGIGSRHLEALESDEARLAGLQLTDFMDTSIFEREPYEQLLRALDDKNVVVFDVESTGTDTNTDEIIQIAALRIDRNGNEVDRFVQFITPTKPVGDSEAVHGFSDAMLAEKGCAATDVLSAFMEFSKGAVIVGHNVNYDISILTTELSRHQLGVPQFVGVYDTLDIFRRFYPNLRNHKLGYLSEYFPIHHQPTHNAWDDIVATAQLLVYAVETNIKPTETMRMMYISRYKSAFATIASQMATLRRKLTTEQPTDLLAYIMNDMGVLKYYKDHHLTDKVEYIRDLYRMIADIEQHTPTTFTGSSRLQMVLELAALTAGEPSSLHKDAHKIPIITIHQSKGSEFDYVYVAGMNQGVFPSMMAVRNNNIDEEKRLFYVGLTRPKQHLFLTYVTHGYDKKVMKRSQLLDYLPATSPWITWEEDNHA